MLKSLTPILWVTSIEGTVAFYEEKLGFSLGFAMRDAAGQMEHAMISKDAVSLMIGYQRAADGQKITQGLGSGAELYLDIDGVDAYYAQITSAGAPVSAEIQDQFWGDRTFSVTDPDGYRLTFSQTVRAFDPNQPLPEAVPA